MYTKGLVTMKYALLLYGHNSHKRGLVIMKLALLLYGHNSHKRIDNHTIALLYG